ncbi:putative leader peptide [Actinospica robiniae]
MASARTIAARTRFSALLVARRHVDLLRVNSALCN